MLLPPETHPEEERYHSVLHSICSAVHQPLELEEVLEGAADKIKELMEVQAVFIFLLDESAGQLELRTHRGVSEGLAAEVTGWKVGEGFNGWVAQTGRPCFVEDVSQDPQLCQGRAKREGIHSLLIVPLRTGGKVIGTLGVAPHALKPFSAAEQELFTLIGTELGGAVEKALLIQELRREGRRRQENLRLYSRQISQAHEEERMRIARELHDDTIQTLVAISRRLDTLISLDWEPDPQRLQPFEEIQQDIDDALVRIRRFVQDLRPPTLEYLGLLPALRELAAQVQEQSDLEVTLKVDGGDRPFSPEESLLIYRIVQEALRNVWRHSEATRAEIHLQFEEEKVTITVRDNGKGFELQDPSELLGRGQLGLMGMQERAGLLGGTLDLASEPCQGTTVSLRIPSHSSGPPAPSREILRC